MSKKVKRKHWSEYPSEDTGYGQHKYGFGVYLISGRDYWLDYECALPQEVIKYEEYCKSKGFTKEEMDKV